MKCRIGFDCSALDATHSPGVRRVARELLDALERRGKLEVVRLAPPRGARLSSWRQLELPRAVRRLQLHGLHSFTSAIPLRGGFRRVQTIHELPWLHGVAENSDLRHRFWASLGSRRAFRVICPSQHVAHDLGRLGKPGGKLRVIPWGVGPEFAPEPPAGSLDEPLLERYRLGSDPLVFCPGAVRAKKNLQAVIRAVALLEQSGGPRVELVVSGPSTIDLRRDLGLAGQLGINARVTTLEHVEEADLPGLLRLASVVPLLSHSEGFALPVLEAFASGTPVLVPPASAQAEIAGPNGQLVDPDDPTSVASGIRFALDAKRTVSLEFPKRAANFSWEASAALVESLWNEPT